MDFRNLFVTCLPPAAVFGVHRCSALANVDGDHVHGSQKRRKNAWTAREPILTTWTARHKGLATTDFGARLRPCYNVCGIKAKSRKSLTTGTRWLDPPAAHLSVAKSGRPSPVPPVNAQTTTGRRLLNGTVGSPI